MKLRDYCKEDAKEICKWINDEKSLRLWSADRYKNFPITDVDINSNYDECIKNGNFYPKTLIDDCNNIIGHLILRNPNGNREIVRLGFIIVDDSKMQIGYNEEDIRVFIPKELRRILMNIDCESCNYKEQLKKYYYEHINVK